MKHKSREERRLSTHAKVRIAVIAGILYIIILIAVCSPWMVI